MANAYYKMLAALLCLPLGACSSIGKVNGVDLNGARMGATSDGPQPFCTQNTTQQWICIIGGATIVGAAAAVIASAHHNHQQSTPLPASSPPPPPTPPLPSGPGR